jgi:hypothetical protein
VLPSSGSTLSDGDFGVINATTGAAGVPEPNTWALMSLGMAGLAVASRRKNLGRLNKLFHMRGMLSKVLPVVLCLVAGQVTFAQIHLNTWTTPDSGTAGINTVNVIGSSFPAGQITPANVMVTLSPTCAGAASASTSAISVITLIGTSRRVSFLVPGTLATGMYFVSLSDSGAGGDVSFNTGSSCSEVSVTHTNPTLSACLPSSSLVFICRVKP